MLIFFVIVILVALALQWYSLRNAGDFRNIRYECKPSVRACEPGDVFLVHSNLSNTDNRASAELYIEEHFPQQLIVKEAERYNVVELHNDYRIYRKKIIILM